MGSSELARTQDSDAFGAWGTLLVIIWRCCQVLNPGPSACSADILPLSYHRSHYPPKHPTLTILAVFAIVPRRAIADIFGENISPIGNHLALATVQAGVGMAGACGDREEAVRCKKGTKGCCRLILQPEPTTQESIADLNSPKAELRPKHN